MHISRIIQERITSAYILKKITSGDCFVPRNDVNGITLEKKTLRHCEARSSPYEKSVISGDCFVPRNDLNGINLQ